MAVVLDAGGLIAVERQDRAVGALLRVAQRERIPVRTSAAVVARVWRSGRLQANLARVLTGVEAVPLDGGAGRRVGEVLARTGTADVVDGHLGLVVREDDHVLTGDTDDIVVILRARGVRAVVRKV